MKGSLKYFILSAALFWCCTQASAQRTMPGRCSVAIIGGWNGSSVSAEAFFSQYTLTGFWEAGVVGYDYILPINVGGTLTVTPGSRIEVDVSKYAGKKGRHALLTAGAVDGSFADGDVEITGVDSGRTVTEARILTQDGGIYLSLSKGLFIIFR